MSVPLESSRDLYEFLARYTNPRFIEIVRKHIRKEEWQFEVVTSSKVLFTTKASGRANAANEKFLHRKRNFSFPNCRRKSHWGKVVEKKVWVELKTNKVFLKYLAKYHNQPLRGETCIPTPKKATTSCKSS